MGSQRIEFESEAWYRAVAEGRLGAVSDGRWMRREDVPPHRPAARYPEPMVPPVTARRPHSYR
jgi:hypothetical protein